MSLCFSIFGAEVFNLAFWQRIYASRDTRQLRIGFCVGGGTISLLTFLFGVGGLVLKANNLRETRDGVGSPIAVPAFTFFEVLDMPGTGKWLRVLIYVLALCMIASCADSFQTAITSVVSRELRRHKMTQKSSLLVGELLVVGVNVPAMFFAIYSANDNAKADGLAVKLTDLFGMADVLTITLVVPLLSGLWPYVTTKGCLAGLMSGILFILVWGWVEFGTFMAGLEMITLMCFGNTQVEPSGYSAYACGPWYARRSPIMFSTIPLVTGAATYLVSWMERCHELLTRLNARLEANSRSPASPQSQPVVGSHSHAKPAPAAPREDSIDAFRGPGSHSRPGPRLVEPELGAQGVVAAERPPIDESSRRPGWFCGSGACGAIPIGRGTSM